MLRVRMRARALRSEGGDPSPCRVRQRAQPGLVPRGTPPCPPSGRAKRNPHRGWRPRSSIRPRAPSRRFTPLSQPQSSGPRRAAPPPAHGQVEFSGLSHLDAPATAPCITCRRTAVLQHRRPRRRAHGGRERLVCAARRGDRPLAAAELPATFLFANTVWGGAWPGELQESVLQQSVKVLPRISVVPPAPRQPHLTDRMHGPRPPPPAAPPSTIA
jgi:hypothetical protein